MWGPLDTKHLSRQPGIAKHDTGTNIYMMSSDFKFKFPIGWHSLVLQTLKQQSVRLWRYLQKYGGSESSECAVTIRSAVVVGQLHHFKSKRKMCYPSIYLPFICFLLSSLFQRFPPPASCSGGTSILCFDWWFTKRWALIVVFFTCQLKLCSMVTLSLWVTLLLWREPQTNIKNSHLAKKSRYSNRCQLVLWRNVAIVNTIRQRDEVQTLS